MALPEGYSIKSLPEEQPVETPEVVTAEQPIQQPASQLPEGYSIKSQAPLIGELQASHVPGQYEKSKLLMDQMYSGHVPTNKQYAIDELTKRGALKGKSGETFSLASLESGMNKREDSISQTISDYARPLLSGVAGGVGAIAGTPAGPLGTVAGGGLGYAMGEEAADLLDEFLGLRERKPLVVELTESGLDIVEGATMEMGGQLFAYGVGKGIGAGKKALQKIASKGKPITQKGAVKKASEVLAAETPSGPIIANNIDDAVAIEAEIPGIKFSRGQLTNDPNVIRFERARGRMPGDVAQEQLEAAAGNAEAIQKYIDKRKGVEGIEEVTGALTAKKEAVETGIKKTTGKLEAEAAQLEGAPPAEDIGKVIKEEAIAGKKAAKVKSGELFKEVPEVDIDGSSLIKKIDELSEPLSKFEDVAENIPKEFKFFKEILSESDGVVKVGDLQGLRSSLTDSIRDLKGASAPNNRKLARLNGLLKEVDNVIESAPTVQVSGEAIEAGKKLKTARSFFKKEVVEKYGKGAVGDILKKGGDKVSNANVAGKFFKKGFKGSESAQEFISAVGDNKNARGALEDYIKQDLLSNVTNPATGEVVETKLKTWLNKHKPALKKLGIEKKYDSLVKASEELTTAREMKISFDKSVASKLLKSDVDTEVKNAFGSGSKKKAAIDLMKDLKGNKKAISGLQNSTIDHIIKNAKTTAPDAFGNPIISYAKVEKEYNKYKPAIDVMFKDSPEKLKALDQYRKAFKIMQRGKSSPMTGGPETAELLITMMANSTGIAKSKALTIAKAVISPLIEMSDNQVNAILNRAATDPDFAYTIQMLAKGKPTDKVEQRLKGHLAAVLMRDSKKDKE